MLKQGKWNLRRILVIYYVVFVATVLVASWVNKQFDWDMLGYTASALHFENSDTAAIHKTVYEALKSAADPKDYASLTQGSPYVANMFARADWFAQQLPYYEIRLIHNGLIYLFYKMGANIMLAPFVVSVMAAGLGLIALFFAGLNRLDDRLMFLLPFVFMFSDGLYVARMPTPDSLGFAFFMLFAYLLLRGGGKPLLILMPILVLVRTDFVIFGVLFLAFLIYKDPLNRRAAIVSLAVTLGVYFGINKITGNYGWATIFYFTLIDRVPNPAELHLSVSVQQYFTVLSGALGELLNSKFLVYYLLALGFNLYLLKRLGTRSARTAATLVFVVLAYNLCHFALFPRIGLGFSSLFMR